ncbi:MAG: hypothetical protein A3J93_02540 [Candidatus Magasanikbacteria bacterium RIFOXYC2_FULL_42_28]|uniref:Uncharacterized protein n=1 Tax=Candidatus Magasanikbacteria bacterium RIFOXYC2_FULL_42_28 TaxID=1798704 RepID=A0A1F6NVQ3_9BACT|nr:MAG: hypothetical protein A3J93_02540 [Candidatus Magasanikbacteria bacterium RIFOXYC2_FULL_42_28]
MKAKTTTKGAKAVRKGNTKTIQFEVEGRWYEAMGGLVEGPTYIDLSVLVSTLNSVGIGDEDCKFLADRLDQLPSVLRYCSKLLTNSRDEEDPGYSVYFTWEGSRWNRRIERIPRGYFPQSGRDAVQFFANGEIMRQWGSVLVVHRLNKVPIPLPLKEVAVEPVRVEFSVEGRRYEVVGGSFDKMPMTPKEMLAEVTDLPSGKDIMFVLEGQSEIPTNLQNYYLLTGHWHPYQGYLCECLVYDKTTQNWVIGWVMGFTRKYFAKDDLILVLHRRT